MTYFRHGFSIAQQYDSFEQGNLLCGNCQEVYFYNQFEHAICSFTIPNLQTEQDSGIQQIQLQFNVVLGMHRTVYDLCWHLSRLYVVQDGALTVFDPETRQAVTHGCKRDYFKFISSEDGLFLLSPTLNTVDLIDPASLAILKRIQLCSIPVSVFKRGEAITIVTQDTIAIHQTQDDRYPQLQALPAKATAVAVDFTQPVLIIATKQRKIIQYDPVTARNLGSLQNAMKYQPIAVQRVDSRVVVLSQANECLVHSLEQKSDRYSGIRADSAWHGWYLNESVFVGLTACSIYIVPNISCLENRERCDDE